MCSCCIQLFSSSFLGKGFCRFKMDCDNEHATSSLETAIPHPRGPARLPWNHSVLIQVRLWLKVKWGSIAATGTEGKSSTSEVTSNLACMQSVYVVRAISALSKDLGILNGGLGVSGGVVKVSRELVGEKLSFPHYRLRISLESIRIWKLDTSELDQE